jgi:uridine kinase
VGGSGSGKTWFADKLAAALAPDAARLSLDDFYRDRSNLSLARREKVNFDHPRAIDWSLVEKVLREILKGRPVRLPCYDFPTHCRTSRSRILKPKPIIFMDGLWLLRRPSVRSLFGFSIFLDCERRIRFRRRLERDLQMRGRTEASIRKQIRKTVEPMYARYVAPLARFANVVLRGSCSQWDVQRLARFFQIGSITTTRHG